MGDGKSKPRVENQLRRVSARVHDAIDLPPEAKAGGILVSLVHTEGSCYQKAGAQLFISQAKQVFGLVSGGCLEQAILDEGLSLQSEEHAPARLKCYETGEPGEIDFGYGLGCGGTLWVFFEMIRDRVRLDELLLRPREEMWEAWVVESEQSSWLGRRRNHRSQLQALDAPEQALAAALEQLRFERESERRTQARRSALLSITIGDKPFKIAVNRKPAQVFLAIFGAGPGAWPLAEMGRLLGWQVIVYDHRPSYVEDFPKALAPVELLPRDAAFPWPQVLERDAETGIRAAIVMTHNFSRDGELLQKLLRGKWSYLGVMGSQQRWQTLRRDFALSESPALHAPAGLRLGGDDIQAIALSIIAEIQAHVQPSSGLSLSSKLSRVELPQAKVSVPRIPADRVEESP